MELEGGRSFASIHATIEKMRHVDTWTQKDREELFKIALRNGQVRYILGDLDVRSFYTALLNTGEVVSEEAKELQRLLDHTGLNG